MHMHPVWVQLNTSHSDWIKTETNDFFIVDSYKIEEENKRKRAGMML